MSLRLEIDPQRLWASLMELASIGAFRDERTGLQGVNRLALTPAEGEGRRRVVRWFEEAGLSVRVDQIGNCYGRRKGKRDDSPVLIGSHIDSVPTAGAFDGCLGVLGGLEVVRTLNAAQVTTGRPLEVAFFTDEEGARFGTDMLGSAVAVGRISLERALALTDREGQTVGSALAAIGFQGSHPVRLTPPHAYLECHIEQGPTLRAASQDLGVVTGVQAISWQEVTFIGRSAHAGTTPMHLRKDAGLAAARLCVHLHEMTKSGSFGELRATMGELKAMPGVTNIVPGRALCTVDLRNPDDAAMLRAEDALSDFLQRLSIESGVEVSARRTARTSHVPFSPRVQRVLAEKMDARGKRHQSIISGAGHDAQELAAICDTGMIFVPGEYEGISHNPREYSTPQQCQDGVNVLLDAVLALSE